MTTASATSPQTAQEISCDEALRIAWLDAEKAYRTLSRFGIEISREYDGSHIDYRLKNTQVNGGGPHYVIDAQTGVILAKRYEQ